MAFLVIAGVAFLAGAASAVFLVTVITIRKNDRPERILNAAQSRPRDSAQTAASSGTWPDVPVYRP